MAKEKSSGLAIAGMVLGIIGIVISFTPCLWMVGIVPVLVGLILSFIALRRVKAGKASGRGMAMGGLICSIIGIVVWFIAMSILGKAVSDVEKEVDKASKDIEKASMKFDEEVDKATMELDKAANQDME
jgi:amino acid transporter